MSLDIVTRNRMRSKYIMSMANVTFLNQSIMLEGTWYRSVTFTLDGVLLTVFPMRDPSSDPYILYVFLASIIVISQFMISFLCSILKKTDILACLLLRIDPLIYRLL